ncbi:MAG: hypothetical protein PVG54_16715 [Anaerolineae bacterium]|jgi:hypothetical protein
MQRRPLSVRLLIPLVLLIGLACGPCNLLSGEMPTPAHPIAISTEAAGQLESRIQQNLGGEPGKQFILRVTDAEITSLLATELARYDESPVSEPQIWFSGGNIHGVGKLVNVLPVETEFYVVASARIVDGKIAIEILEFTAGAMPVPESLLSTISQSINETVEDVQVDVRVTALEILEGEAIIQGVRN